MKTKVEVYPATEQEGNGYWVCVCIHIGSYYKHMQKSRVHCLDKQAVSEAVWRALNHHTALNVVMFFQHTAGMVLIHTGVPVMKM